jgi:hypothetical protein
MGTIQLIFAERPIAPMFPKNLFLFLLARTVMGIGVSQCQPESALIVSKAPGLGTELSAEPQRPEALIVKVVDPSFRQSLQFRFQGWLVAGIDGPKDDLKSIPKDLLGAIGPIGLA